MKLYALALLVVPAAFGQAVIKCSEIGALKIAGMKIEITKANVVPAAGALPAHCIVEGMIDRRTGAGGKTYGTGFAVALPENWNERLLFQGGGGYNGVTRAPLGAAAAGDLSGLARGFTVVSTDTGHQGGDQSFFADQQAGLDFAYVAIGRVAVLAKQVINDYYGKPARYSYFVGCSTGGREAMTMTQRFPDYFDGVVSGDPAMRTRYAEISRTWATVAFNQIAPKDDSGKLAASPVFSDADKKVVADGLLAACDAQDGIKDGMIFNTKACNFDPTALVCKASKNDSCLSAQQAAAMKKAYTGPRNLKGELVYPPPAYDTGISLPGVLKGPSLITELDVDARMSSVLADAMNALTDTTSTYLSSFSGRGGKLLFYHGMSDTGFSPLDTIAYYEKMSKANGGMDQVQNWSRLYLVPGMGHCRGGAAALDDFDLLTAVTNWVEKGTAPDSVIAKGKALPGRSRPLCAYPKHAQYTGTGDPEDAKNFACRD